MKRIFFLFLSTIFILPLFGCTVNTGLCKECVTDSIEYKEFPEMYIESDIPQGATLTLSRDDGRCAIFTHPDYEVTQEIFSADSWDSAFRHISGRGSEDLKRFLAGNFPQEKYRCTWTVAGEDGTDLCQSVVLFDGSYYYAVTVQCAANKSREYAEVFSDLLSGICLCSI